MRTIEQIQLYVANANVSLADYWAQYLQAKADGDPDTGFMGRRIGIIKLYLFTIQSYIDNKPTEVKTINSLFNSLLSYLPSDFFLSDYTFYNPLATNISGAVVISAAAKASNTIYGIVRLNVAPLLESDPVALGANDPRISIWDSAYALAEDAFNNRITSSVFNSLGQLVLTKADASTVTSTNKAILSQSDSAQTADFWISGQARASQFVVSGGLSTQFLKADGTLDSNVYLTGNQTVTLSGEASGSGATAISVTLSNAAVISKVLTGYVSGAGTVSSTDSLLTAIQKLDGNIGALVTGVSSVFGRTGAVTAQSGDYTTTLVTEGTNLYFTNARARGAISLTVTGSSGAATYNSTTGVLNIPTYTLAGLGGQPLSTNLTSLSGLTYSSLAFVKMTAAGTFALDTNTYLTGNQTITLSGEASGSGATSISVTLSNSAVINKVLSGYVSGAGVVSATDSILTAIQKLNGNISALVTGVSSVFGRTGVVAAQSGDYTTAQVTESGNLYYTDARARAAISETITGISYNNTTGVFSLTAGYVIPTTTDESNWNSAYNDTILSASVTGTSSKTITLTQRDGNTIQASWDDLGLTSVGLEMPSAFVVTNSPLTSNGVITVTGAGVASQYIRGDGSLADFPTSAGGGGASVSYYLNGSVNQGTIAGVTYYEVNKTPVLGAGTDFTVSSNGYIASFITDTNDPALLKIPAGNFNLEIYFSASSGGGTPSYYIELYKYNGTTFTLIASNATSPDIITGGTSSEAYFSTLAVPETTLAITDRLAFRIYVNTSGRTITLHTEDNHLCQVITTFTTGLTALNGLTSQVQYFTVGTSGSDFNIFSSGDTHTFNLPTASASVRGALSSTDWSTFNAKENAITSGTTLQYFRGDKTFQTLNTSVVPEVTNLYFTQLRARQSISETITGIDYDSNTGVFSLTSGYVIPTTTSTSEWDTAYSSRIATFTTTGNSGSATFSGNTLNIPTYTLAGLGGQPLNTNLTSLSNLAYSSLAFVKMTASGTFALDTNTYLTSTTGVTTVAGTANQVLVNGGTSAVSGAVTLTLPQSIATTSTPQFAAIGIGVAAQSRNIQGLGVGGTRFLLEGTDFYSSTISAIRNGNDIGAPVLYLAKTRATVVGGSTVVQNGDRLGTVSFAGADGTSTYTGASIYALVNGTPSAGNIPAELRFNTAGVDAMIINTSQNVIISDAGYQGRSIAGAARILQIEGAGSKASQSIIRNSNDTSGANLYFGKTRGASAGSNTAVQAGDTLGFIGAMGADGTSITLFPSASISLNAGNTISTGIVSGRISLSTQNSSGTLVEGLRMLDNQRILIQQGGTFTDSGEQLQVTGTTKITGATTLGSTLAITAAVTGSSTARFTKLGIGADTTNANNFRITSNITGFTSFFNVINDSTIQSDVISNVQMFRAVPSTAAAAFTLGTLINYQSGFETKGAGSTITEFIGYNASDTSVATTTKAFNSNVNSGTNKWGFYANGTASNYFAGKVQIGSTTDGGELLQVTGTARITGATAIGSTLAVTGALSAGVSGVNNAMTFYVGTSAFRIGRNTSQFIDITQDASTTRMLATTAGKSFVVGTAEAQSLVLQTNNTTALTIASTGAATFSSSVTAGGQVTTTSVSGYRLLSGSDTLFSLGYSGGTLLNRLTGTSLFLAENGTPQLTIASGGAATFSNTLTVSSGGSTNGRLGVRGTTNDSSAYAFEAANLSGNTIFIVRNDGQVWMPSGNVGIGTTTPAGILHVNGQGARFVDSVNTFGLIVGAASASPNWVAIGTSGTGVPQIQGYNNAFSATTNLALQPNGGNVGIGTTTPSEKLSVIGNINISNTGTKIGFNTVDSFTNYSYSAAHYGISYGFGATPLTLSGYFGLSLVTSGVERLLITQAGDATFSSSITWGTIAGTYMYAGGASHRFAYSSSVLNVIYSGGSSGLNINNQADNSVLVKVLDSGNVGIGNSSPSYKLDVTGDIRSTSKVYIGTNGAFIEEVLVSGVYKLRVTDSAGNTTVL